MTMGHMITRGTGNSNVLSAEDWFVGEGKGQNLINFQKIFWLNKARVRVR